MSRKKKILLVDDSRTSLFMEQMILKKEPYDKTETFKFSTSTRF